MEKNVPSRRDQLQEKNKQLRELYETTQKAGEKESPLETKVGKKERLNLLNVNSDRIESLIRITEKELALIDLDEKADALEEILKLQKQRLEKIQFYKSRKIDIAERRADEDSIRALNDEINGKIEQFKMKYGVSFDSENSIEELFNQTSQSYIESYERIREDKKTHLENYSKAKVEIDFLNSLDTNELLEEQNLLRGKLNKDYSLTPPEEVEKMKKEFQRRIDLIEKILKEREEEEAKASTVSPTPTPAPTPAPTPITTPEPTPVAPSSVITPPSVKPTIPASADPAITTPLNVPENLRNRALDAIFESLNNAGPNVTRTVEYIRRNLATIIIAVLVASGLIAGGRYISNVSQEQINNSAKEVISAPSTSHMDINASIYGKLPQADLENAELMETIEAGARGEQPKPGEINPEPSGTTLDEKLAGIDTSYDQPPENEYKEGQEIADEKIRQNLLERADITPGAEELEKNIEMDIGSQYLDYNGYKTFGIINKSSDIRAVPELDVWIKVGDSVIDVTKYMDYLEDGSYVLNLEKLTSNVDINPENVKYISYGLDGVRGGLASDFSNILNNYLESVTPEDSTKLPESNIS